MGFTDAPPKFGAAAAAPPSAARHSRRVILNLE